MPGGGRERPLLAPSGEASIDEPRVAGKQYVGPEAESLDDTRAKRLEERVSLVDEAQHRCNPVGMLQVDGDRTAAAVPRRSGPGRRVVGYIGQALHADDVRAHVGQP